MLSNTTRREQFSQWETSLSSGDISRISIALNDPTIDISSIAGFINQLVFRSGDKIHSSPSNPTKYLREPKKHVFIDIDITKNNVNDRHIPVFSKLLKNRQVHITNINISGAAMSPDKIIEIFIPSIANSSSLSSFLARDCAFCDVHMSALCKAFKTGGRNLKVLDLSQNNISSQGCHYLSDICHALSQLKSLSLAGNPIGSSSTSTSSSPQFGSKSNGTNKFFHTLASTACSLKARRKYFALSSLVLSSCGLGPTTVVGLSELLSLTHIPLSRLNISHNNLGDEGLANILSVCERTDKLKYLDISGTFISGPNANSLIHYLSSTHNLTQVKATHNPIPYGQLLRCKDIIVKRKVTKQFDISQDPMLSPEQCSSLEMHLDPFSENGISVFCKPVVSDGSTSHQLKQQSRVSRPPPDTLESPSPPKRYTPDNSISSSRSSRTAIPTSAHGHVHHSPVGAARYDHGVPVIPGQDTDRDK
ncbi:hypothetical protein ADUPG1_000176, partial [Aduncisulcus paluster]